MLKAVKNLNLEKCKDSGLALVLICLLCYISWPHKGFLAAAIVFQLLAMISPGAFKPFAIFWFMLSAILGAIIPRLILTLLFYVLVFPVGALRRLAGKDAMRQHLWHKGKDSVFRARNHRYTADDLETPY